MTRSLYLFTFILLFSISYAQETDWSIEGIGITTDNCVVGCPCVLGEAPTHGRCTYTGILLIEKGSYGKTDLKGLKIAIGGAFGRPHSQDQQQYDFAAFYIDASGTDEQKQALRKIFESPEMGVFGKPIEVKEVSITITGSENFGQVGKTVQGTIGDFAKIEITPISGAIKGKPLVIENSAEPLFHWTALGKSSNSYYKGAGQDWKFEGTSGESQRFLIQNTGTATGTSTGHH